MCGSSSTTRTRAAIVLSPFVHVAVTSFQSNHIQGVNAMTTTFKRVVLAAVAVAGIAGVALAPRAIASDQNTSQAPPPFMGRGRGPGGPMGPGGPGMLGLLPRLGRELQLTDTQQQQIKAIAASHKDEWKALG